MRTTQHSVQTADGVHLAVTMTGPMSAAPVLLIPGLGAAASVFDALVPAFERHHRLVLYDPRGIGDSDNYDGNLSMDMMVADAVAVIESAGVERAHVVGASMGGTVAQYLVTQHPETVDRLILAATAPGGRKAVPADTRATAALMGKGARTPGEAYRLATTVLYSAHFQRTHPDFIEAQIRQRSRHPVRPRVFSNQAAALAAAPDISDALSRLAAPVLVAHGTADAVTPIENAQLLAALIPGARWRWFEGCGHLFFHERPEESARVFHEFLRDATEGSATH